MALAAVSMSVSPSNSRVRILIPDVMVSGDGPR